jgi:hypothetical protein
MQMDERRQEHAAERVAEPRCSANIAFANWTVFFVFNLVFLSLAASGITHRSEIVDPIAGGLFLVFSGVGAIGCVYLTARGVRVAVWIDGDRIHVRNYVSSYSIATKDAIGFSYDYPQARMPGYGQAGSLQLKDGTVKPVAAISRGTWLSSNPMRSGAEILSDLNAALGATWRESAESIHA